MKSTIDEIISYIENGVSDTEIQSLVSATDLHRSRFSSWDQDISENRSGASASTKEKIAIPGANLSPGVGIGALVLDVDLAEQWVKEKKRKVILIRPFYKPDDVHGVIASSGAITVEEGATSHLAVVARQFGIPAVGCGKVRVDLEKRICSVGDLIIREGDQVIIDGTTGTLFFDPTSRGIQEEDISKQNAVLSSDNFEKFINRIYSLIIDRRIDTKGIELAVYCLIAEVELTQTIQELPKYGASFEYLNLLLVKTHSTDLAQNITTQTLKDLFNMIGMFIASTSLDALENSHKGIVKNLSRLNALISQSTQMRHIMLTLEKSMRHVDWLVTSHYEREKVSDVSQLGPKILVVEDEPYLLQPVLDALENSLNAEIILATTTEDGIDALQSGTPVDILICDIMLPMNDDLSENPYQGGLTVCKTARELRGSDLPIICLSVVTDASVWESLRKIGVDIRINKPVMISELLSIIRETLISIYHGPKTELILEEIKRRKLELNDKSPAARIRALWALYQLGKYDASIFAYIQATINTEKDDKVKSVAFSICEEFEKKQKHAIPAKLSRFAISRENEAAANGDLITRLDRLEETLGKKLDNIRNGQIAIYNRINATNQLILDKILGEVHQGRIEQGELQRTVDATRRSIRHILDTGVKINDADVVKSLSDIYESVNSSLTFEQQFELTLPVIPFLLEYKINLGAGIDLQAVWDELISRLKNREN